MPFRENEIIARKIKTQHLEVNGNTIAGGVAVGALDLVDLNGVADALVLDTDGDTTISAPTDNQIDIEIAGADDFRYTANTFTALSGSTIATNTIAETTAASGVTIDGVLVKDGGAVFADAAVIEIDTINEATAAAGVTVDGVLLKDSVVTAAVTGNVTGTHTGTHIGGQQDAVVAITGDGAITIAPSSVFLSKGSAAAITIAAPTTVTHDGYIVRIVAKSAHAHVITSGVRGFNAKASSGTVTLGGALGDSVTLIAHGGDWWTLAKVNATVA